MRNRRTVVVAFLLVAVLLLGVGYAAVTDVLDINGTADVNQSAAQDAFDEDIYFTGAVANMDGDYASVDTNDSDLANFTVNSLNGQGDYATFTFTITNDGDLDAVVTPTLAQDGNTNAEYFRVTSDWNATAKTIAAGENATYTVTVELLKTPTDTIHGAFHIELHAVAGTVTTEAQG